MSNGAARRLVLGVMLGRADGVVKAGVGVRREIDDGVGVGCDHPATSMSSMTSPSGPLGSPVALFRSWSTETLSAHPKPGRRLRPVVEAEHPRDDSVQLVRQMDRPRPPAIGTAGVLESLKVHLERIIELGNRAGEDDCTDRQVFLDDSQTVSAGKLPDFRDVGGIGSVLLSELIAAQMPIRSFTLGQPGNSAF